MSQPIARKGDSHSHGGTIIEGSPNWKCNGASIARVGDAITCPIHGQGTITTSQSKKTVNGRLVAHVGSACSCGAVITSGSSSWGAGP